MPYTADMKLADIIAADRGLLSILERLNIKLGFADADVGEVCRRYELSADLFLMICNIYSFEDYMPNIENLKDSDIPRLVAYLRASHNYYTERFFPRLHRNIHSMLNDCDEVNSKVLNRFYDNYDAEITNHFGYEEHVVFPYIERLVAHRNLDGNEYCIETFFENHSNIEETLNDLKNIVIKYIPEEFSTPVRFEVIANIFQIERDLRKHTLVENKLLIPLVAKLERNE